MNGQDFLAYVKRKLKREDKDAEIYEATTDVIADMRIQFHSNDFKIETTLTGIASLGEYTLDLPSNFGHLIGDVSIYDSDTNEDFLPLQKISKQKFDEIATDRLLSSHTLMSKQRPKFFCVYGNDVLVYPVPDKLTYVYKANITTEPFEEVTSSTDPVPFTDRYRNILRYGVLADIHDGMENYEESNYNKQLYIDGLSKIISNDRSNITDNLSISYNGI